MKLVSIKSVRDFHKGTSQASLVIALLMTKGWVATDQLEYLGIKSPSGVIAKLRKHGFKIKTDLVYRFTYKNKLGALQAVYTLSNDGEV